MNRLRRLQLVAHGEPSDVIELSTVSQPALGQEDVLISMEAAPVTTDRTDLKNLTTKAIR